MSILGLIISDFTIPSNKESFIVRDKFRNNNKEVNIFSMNANFKNWFMDKEENQFSGSTIYGRYLKTTSASDSILSALGGAERAEMSLNEVYALLKINFNNQGHSSDAWINLFYVPDTQGILRKLRVERFLEGWSIKAFPIDSLNFFFTDSRVFSRFLEVF